MIFYLKMVVLKSLENEFAFNWQTWSLFQTILSSTMNKLQNMYHICKQFEKLMFIVVL